MRHEPVIPIPLETWIMELARALNPLSLKPYPGLWVKVGRN